MRGEHAMPRNKNKPKVRRAKKEIVYSPEEQESLDSGLRMLASMIAETHMKRIASDPEYRNKLRKRLNHDVEK